jgi:seryl-tRNA synthetase
MTMDDVAGAQKEFLDQLIAHRLLIPSGVPGVYGRGFHFEDVIERFDRLITEAGKDDGAERLRFPPVINRAHFEKSEYLKSMPQLAGAVFSFTGDAKAHMKLLELVHEGKDWSSSQTMTDVVLTPAACYPLYPMAAADGPIPEPGRLFDVYSYCFRHEPSGDPARQQMFRMREFVRIAHDEEGVRGWRDQWVKRGRDLLAAIGLDGSSAPANDPFFGRGGKMLAANQRDQNLKFELVYPITSTENPTALLSFNYHQDHFGGIFGIRSSRGGVAQTACVGFGMERVALALFKTHGLDPATWPAAVRAKLYPS